VRGLVNAFPIAISGPQVMRAHEELERRPTPKGFASWTELSFTDKFVHRLDRFVRGCTVLDVRRVSKVILTVLYSEVVYQNDICGDIVIFVETR
jgi:hypothetical protein